MVYLGVCGGVRLGISVSMVLTFFLL